ncbi:uncharacterized protein [Euphorbia lathyris]|uniref:uncharacterized protein isoform X2 n=1 Tax=Euphorbia lathyris TaxID=212925 RepID=UPI00331347F0
MKESSDVHVIPCLDPTSKCRIQQAERIIQCMNKKRFAIFDQIEQLKLDRENVIWKLKNVKYRDRSLRYKSNNQREKLEPLQLALDKLKFNNNAYSDGDQIKSMEDEIDPQNLKFRVIHGSNSLAEERRVLKKTKKNQQRGANYSSMEELSFPIMQLNFRSQCYSNDESQRRKIIEQIKELKWKREKTIANAAVNGRFWRSVGPKQTIQQNIKIIEEEVEETRKDHLAVRAEMKLLEKNLEHKMLIALKEHFF